MTKVRSTEVTEVTDAKAEALRLPRRRRLNCHRQLPEVMTEVRWTEVTTELADMDSVEVKDLEAADAGSSDASTATGCRCQK